jgi:predicted NodU family carbamoyl transferase
MVVDGIGEFESSSFYVGEATRLHRLRHYEYPDSLGFLWEKLSAYLGFSIYDASKAMGLSSYGEPGGLRRGPVEAAAGGGRRALPRRRPPGAHPQR